MKRYTIKIEVNATLFEDVKALTNELQETVEQFDCLSNESKMEFVIGEARATFFAKQYAFNF